jgi:predicted nucleic acid-binding protein
MTMKAGELLFLDTNILLTATSEDRDNHHLALDLFTLAPASGVHLAVSGQVLREYLVVATRPPGSNGLGLSTSNAIRNVKVFQSRTLLLDEPEEVTERLFDLVDAHGLSGKRIHDANIVAVMKAHLVSTILTSNTSDFATFQEISAISPGDITQMLSAYPQ